MYHINQKIIIFLWAVIAAALSTRQFNFNFHLNNVVKIIYTEFAEAALVHQCLCWVKAFDIMFEQFRFHVCPIILSPPMVPKTSDCFVTKEDWTLGSDARVITKDMVEGSLQPWIFDGHINLTSVCCEGTKLWGCKDKLDKNPQISVEDVIWYFEHQPVDLNETRCEEIAKGFVVVI